MNILAFDTSTEKFSICILKNNRVVLNLSKILNKTYSKFLIPILKKSLEKTKLDIKEINYILISLGPGSFTGVRIGIAAAKGLGIPHKISISGFNNMDILANSIDHNIKDKKKRQLNQVVSFFIMLNDMLLVVRLRSYIF